MIHGGTSPAWLALLAIVCTACTSSFPPVEVDAGPVDAAPPPPTTEDRVLSLFDALDDVLCRREIECEPGTLTEQGDGACHPSQRGISDEGREWLRDGTWVVDEEALAACIAALAAGEGCVTWDDWEMCDPISRWTLGEGDACDPEWPGCDYEALYCDRASCTCVPNRPLGEACVEDRECPPWSWCSRDTSTCTPIGEGAPCTDSCVWINDDRFYCVDGMCTVDLPDFMPGDACIAGECGPDLFCFYVDGESLCDSPRLEGEVCLVRGCADDLVCLDGFCTPGLTEGEACDWLTDCATGLFCVDPVFGEPGVCRTDPTGDPCYLSEWSPGRCPEGWACVLNPARADEILDNGSCQPAPPAELGGACISPSQCPMSSRCVDGTCVRVVFPTEPCGPDAVCPSSHTCDDGACQPRPVRGEPCDADHRCWDGLCFDGTCGGLPAGETCDSYLECEGYCDYDFEEERCRSLGDVGAICEYDFQCIEGTYCMGSGVFSEGICTANICA